MKITIILAPQPLTCFRCVSIGLPLDGIASGDTCAEIDNNGSIEFACMDCFDRLECELGEAIE